MNVSKILKAFNFLYLTRLALLIGFALLISSRVTAITIDDTTAQLGNSEGVTQFAGLFLMGLGFAAEFIANKKRMLLIEAFVFATLFVLIITLLPNIAQTLPRLFPNNIPWIVSPPENPNAPFIRQVVLADHTSTHILVDVCFTDMSDLGSYHADWESVAAEATKPLTIDDGWGASFESEACGGGLAVRGTFACAEGEIYSAGLTIRLNDVYGNYSNTAGYNLKCPVEDDE